MGTTPTIYNVDFTEASREFMGNCACRHVAHYDDMIKLYPSIDKYQHDQ